MSTSPRRASSCSPTIRSDGTSPLESWRKQRYASFELGAGLDFENGRSTLADLRDLAVQAGAAEQRSGRQEAYENLFNQYLIR